MTKPRLDQGADYERGFVDGMLKQAQSSVDKAVNSMSHRTWVGLTDEEAMQMYLDCSGMSELLDAIDAKLKQKNGYAEDKNT